MKKKEGFVIRFTECTDGKFLDKGGDVVSDLRLAKVFNTREKARALIDKNPAWGCLIEPLSKYLVVGYTLVDGKVVAIDCFKPTRPASFDKRIYPTVGKKRRGRWCDDDYFIETYEVYETKAACIKAEIKHLKNTIQYHKIEIKDAEKKIKKLQTMKGSKK